MVKDVGQYMGVCIILIAYGQNRRTLDGIAVVEQNDFIVLFFQLTDSFTVTGKTIKNFTVIGVVL